MRLLFIRFSSIGDIVLTTPAVRCAKLQIPGVEIHYLTKIAMRELVEANPYIDQCHYLDNDIHKTIQHLKAFDFDYIIDLHHNFRTWRIKWALDTKWVTYQKRSLQKWLLTKFKINLLPASHVCYRYLATLRFFNVQYDGQGLDYFLPNPFQVNSIELPMHFKKGYQVLVIGASYATKKLPFQQLNELCTKLIGPVVLVGGEGDAAIGQMLEAMHPQKILNTCGKLSLHESAFMIKAASVVLSHDTGFLHVAVAFKKPTITIWGSTSPILQFEPFYPDATVVFKYNSLVPGLTCQPCDKQGASKCPKGHFKCMLEQDIQGIAQKANTFLSNLQ